MRRTFLGAIVFVALGAMVACTTDTGTTAPGSPVTINWAPCINDVDAPSWFAVRDGTGGWIRILPTNGAFTFTVKSVKVSIATYANGTLSVAYATPTEFNAYAPTCASARRTVNGSVTGYTSLDAINIQAEQSGVFVSGSQTAPASFTLSNVTPAVFDVVAVRSRSTVVGSTFQSTPTSVFVRRGQTTSPLGLVDLNSATEAGAPLSKTATIVNAATNENLFIEASLNTATTGIPMASYSSTLGTVTGNVTAPFSGVASTRLTTGETQTLDVQASKPTSSTVTDSRFATATYTDVADKTVTLGPALGAVTVTGTSRPTGSYAIQPGYDQLFELDLDQGTGVTARYIQIIMTRGYAGASASQVALDVPDLTGLPGFGTSWLLAPGSAATWTFYAANATIGIFVHNNQTYMGASRTSNFVP